VFVLPQTRSLYTIIMRLFIIVCLLTVISCTKSAVVKTPAVTRDTTLVISTKAVLPAVLKESSGLCYTDGQLWSFGDSGNPNAIFRIDSATGAVLQTVTIANYSNTDWEDIAADAQYIYVGDFGNNNGDRTDLKILRIKKADLDNASVNAEAINFSYTDQTDFTPGDNSNFDCESLLVLHDSLYIFTKDAGDLKTRCYKMPAVPGTYAVSPFTTFNSQGKITAAAYNAATKEIALLGYMNKKIQPFIWLLNNYTADNFFSGTTKRFNIGNQSDWQTEGLDYIDSSRLFMSCESSTSHAATLYEVQKSGF
jgi:hypothetical protein